MSTEEKLKKILDKEPLENLPDIIDLVKNYVLSRYTDEEDTHNHLIAKLQKTIHAITSGDKK